MKALFKAIVLLSVFSIEVRIQAKDLTLTTGCYEADLGIRFDCHALNTSKRVVKKEFSSLQVALDPGAAFSIAQTPSENKIKWIKGEGAIHSTSRVSIETNLGTAQCEKSCVSAFKITDDRFSVHALQGEWQVLSFGHTEHYSLSEGGSINIGLVNEEGKSTWSQPYSLSKESFDEIKKKFLRNHLSEKQIKVIEDLWKKKVSYYSDLYEDRVSRSIASHKAQQAQKERALKQRQAEEQALRELFRRKTLLD